MRAEDELAWLAALGRSVRLTCWACRRQETWRAAEIQRSGLGGLSLARLRRHRTRCCGVLTRVEVLKEVPRWLNRGAELWVVEDWP